MQKFTISKNKENPYLVINKYPINDPNISWRAKGVLAYLLSKPDGWQVREQDIVNHAKDGRDAVRATIKELVRAGYVQKQRKVDGWKFGNMEYFVHEMPIKLVNSTDGRESSNGEPVDIVSNENNQDKKYVYVNAGDSKQDLWVVHTQEQYQKLCEAQKQARSCAD